MQTKTGSVFKGMAPTREERQKCWDARDTFWKCIKSVYADEKNKVPDELSATVKTAKCLKDRQAYEAVCPESWIKMFDRQHDFQLFRSEKAEAELIEAAKSA
ncbi:hypothetical protein AAHC03_010173 [Spirometra sp. Aus1]